MSQPLLTFHLDVWSNWAFSGDINYIIPVFHKNKKRSNVRRNVTLRRVHVTIVTVEVFQHAKCVRRIVLTSVACLAVPHFFSYSHKRRDFQGEKIYTS